MKKKMLVICDSPVVHTGFGKVANFILQSISKLDVEMFQLGINHNTTYYNQKQYPWRIYTPLIGGSSDPYGASILTELVSKYKFDLILIMIDVGILKQYVEGVKYLLDKNIPPVIGYVPLDIDFGNVGEFLKPLEDLDHVVFYTKEQADFAISQGVNLKSWSVIHHGVDTNVYKPYPKEAVSKFRKEVLKIDEDTFLGVNVNRNQFRKDLARSIYIFDKLKGDAKLYLHCKAQDKGGDILEQAKNLGCDLSKLRVYTNHDTFTGVSEEQLALIYNSADIVISTAVGEGWGLSTLEGMACKKLVMAPNNSAFTTILGENRGVLIPVSKDWFMPYSTNSNFPRRVVQTEAFIKALEDFRSDPQKYKKVIDAGYKWALKHDWSLITPKWQELVRRYL